MGCNSETFSLLGGDGMCWWGGWMGVGGVGHVLSLCVCVCVCILRRWRRENMTIVGCSWFTSVSRFVWLASAVTAKVCWSGFVKRRNTPMAAGFPWAPPCFFCMATGSTVSGRSRVAHHKPDTDQPQQIYPLLLLLTPLQRCGARRSDMEMYVSPELGKERQWVCHGWFHVRHFFGVVVVVSCSRCWSRPNRGWAVRHCGGLPALD